MQTRPNIVMFVSDDQGAWALGCAGNKELKTPAIDAIAADGVRFENFFCFSSYPGLDPETATNNSASGTGVDMGTFPTAKQFILGVNLSF